jgi:hypothetical protein
MPISLLKRSAQPAFDEYLTYFTVTEAHEFRRLVARSFADVGRDVDVYPDRIEDRSGTTMGLWNIGALCAGTDVHDWPELIDDHVRLVTTPARELTELSQDELESGLYLRLVEADSVPEPDTLGYARIVAPGLVEVLSVDLGDSVATPSREELSARGTLAELVARGRDNLRALLDDGVHVETVGEGPRGRYTAVTGESLFTASLALLLQETVEQSTGESDWGRGVLVAVPTRHRLLYRTIDAPDARLALERMLEAALHAFHRDVGRLSPDVYWVRKQRWVQATSSRGGKPRVLRGTGLRDALKSV